LDEIRGEIARKSKFNGQLRVILKKLKTSDLSAKNSQH
jgi:hypothetical protein